MISLYPGYGIRHLGTAGLCRRGRKSLRASVPTVMVIGCGGTISSTVDDRLDTLDYPEFGRKLSPGELIGALPESARFADAIEVPFKSIGSSAMTPGTWIELRDLLEGKAAENPSVAGFVILHGTATLEETAYFLNLTLGFAAPVVLTGAQRPFSALSSDAGMNIINAIRVAASSEARGKGVLLVLNDEILAARDGAKTSSYRLQTFQSQDYGLLGQCDADRVEFFRAPLRRSAPDTEFTGLKLETLPRVDIVQSYVGADATFIEAAVDAGARGIVSAGFAPGLPTPQERKALEWAATRGIVVVQCTRVINGRVAPRRYLREAGIVAGGNLSPQKARILLSVALAAGCERDRIPVLFDLY